MFTMSIILGIIQAVQTKTTLRKAHLFSLLGYRYPKNQTFLRAFGILALTYNPSKRLSTYHPHCMSYLRYLYLFAEQW